MAGAGSFFFRKKRIRAAHVLSWWTAFGPVGFPSDLICVWARTDAEILSRREASSMGYSITSILTWINLGNCPAGALSTDAR
jgi:hypothetical protein